MTQPGQPLNENGSVILDGSGNGILTMKPWAGSVTWQPEIVSVSVTQPVTNEASARIYIGPSPDPAYFIDGTLSGSTGDSTDRVTGYSVDTHGNTLWIVWTGGDAGFEATAQVNGTMVTS